MRSRLLSRRSAAVYAALALILLLFTAKIWSSRSAAGVASRAPLAARPASSSLGVLQASLPAPEPLQPPAPAVTVSPLPDKPLPVAASEHNEPAHAPRRESIVRPRPFEPVKGTLNLDSRGRQ